MLSTEHILNKFKYSLDSEELHFYRGELKVILEKKHYSSKWTEHPGVLPDKNPKNNINSREEANETFWIYRMGNSEYLIL